MSRSSTPGSANKVVSALAKEDTPPMPAGLATVLESRSTPASANKVASASVEEGTPPMPAHLATVFESPLTPTSPEAARRRGRAIKEEMAMANHVLGLELVSQNRLDVAAMVFSLALEFAPEEMQKSIFEDRGSVLTRLGDEEGAAADLEIAAELPTDLNYLYGLANEELKRGKFDEAFAHIDQVLRGWAAEYRLLEESTINASVDLAELKSSQLKFAKALYLSALIRYIYCENVLMNPDAVKAAMGEKDGSAESAASRASSEEDIAKKYEEDLKETLSIINDELDQLIALGPTAQYAQACYFKSVIAYEFDKDYESALAHISEAVKEQNTLDPTNTTPLEWRAIMLLSLKSYDAALNDLNELAESLDLPLKLTAFYHRAKVKQIRGDELGASQDFEEILKRIRAEKSFNWSATNLCLRQKLALYICPKLRRKLSPAELDKSISLSKKLNFYWNLASLSLNLARCYFNLKDYKSVITVLLFIRPEDLASSEEALSYFRLRIDSHLVSKSYQHAILVCDQWLAYDPDNEQALSTKLELEGLYKQELEASAQAPLSVLDLGPDLKPVEPWMLDETDLAAARMRTRAALARFSALTSSSYITEFRSKVVRGDENELRRAAASRRLEIEEALNEIFSARRNEDAVRRALARRQSTIEIAKFAKQATEARAAITKRHEMLYHAPASSAVRPSYSFTSAGGAGAMPGPSFAESIVFPGGSRGALNGHFALPAAAPWLVDSGAGPRPSSYGVSPMAGAGAMPGPSFSQSILASSSSHLKGHSALAAAPRLIDGGAASVRASSYDVLPVGGAGVMSGPSFSQSILASSSSQLKGHSALAAVAPRLIDGGASLRPSSHGVISAGGVGAIPGPSFSQSIVLLATSNSYLNGQTAAAPRSVDRREALKPVSAAVVLSESHGVLFSPTSAGLAQVRERQAYWQMEDAKRAPSLTVFPKPMDAAAKAMEEARGGIQDTLARMRARLKMGPA